jgi:hypothetical protein
MRLPFITKTRKGDMRAKLLGLIGASLLLGHSAIAAADTSDVWFIDHVDVAPSQQVSMSYAIPSTDHLMLCMEENSGSDLSSFEWKYKGQTFKSQLGPYQRVTLSRDDYGKLYTRQNQFADKTGTMVITNLDSKYSLTFSCVYTLNPV